MSTEAAATGSMSPVTLLCAARQAMCRRVAGRPDEGLTRLLARYVDRLGSFAALFQPAPGQLPQRLPVLVA